MLQISPRILRSNESQCSAIAIKIKTIRSIKSRLVTSKLVNTLVRDYSKAVSSEYYDLKQFELVSYMWRQIRITSNSNRSLKFLKVLIRRFSDPIATHRSGIFAALLDANYLELVLFNVSTNHYPGIVISGRVINSLVFFKTYVCAIFMHIRPI